MANKTLLEIIVGLKDQTGGGLKKIGEGIKDIHSKAGALKAAAVGTWEVFRGAANIYFAPLKAVAVPALAAVTAGIGLLIKATREWAGQELGEADVKSALIAMGQYSDEYRQKLIDLASTYQDTTGIADDMWLKSLGQLTRFGMTSANVDKVSLALRNLTGLMDGNVEGATDMLAKAMQGEYGMFGRMGIVFKETGDKAKDLAAIMDAINAKGKGLLEARANTLSGKWGQLKNQISEVFEAIGKKSAAGSGLGAWIDLAKDKIKSIATAFDSGELGKSLFKAAEDFSKKLSEGFAWLVDLKRRMDESGQSFGETVEKGLRAATKTLTDALLAAIEASFVLWKTAGLILFQAFKEQFLLLPGMGPIRDIAASNGAKRMSPSEKANFAADNGLVQESKNGKATGNLISMGPVTDERRAEISAKLATFDIQAKIIAAMTDFKTSSGKIGGELVGNLKKNVSSVVPNNAELSVIKAERSAQSLSQQSKGYGDIAAQLPEGKEKAAALALQSQYAAKANDELAKLFQIQQETYNLILAQQASQSSFNEKMRRDQIQQESRQKASRG